ncbi:MAG: sortase, partial [Anaerolineales bacterium]
VTADGLPSISTPTPRALYVEHLVSQNRNGTTQISVDGTTITFGSTITLAVGGTYTIKIQGFTAPGGYEQLEAFLTLNNTVFEILSVDVAYTEPSGATNDQVYADACGWENDPTSPNYRKCSGTGKAGGDLIITYVVRVIGTGTATLQNLIYDFSGSSYHYNDDFVDDFITVIAAEPTPTPTQTPTSTPTGTPIATATQTSTPTPDPGGTATPTPGASALPLPETGFAPGRRSYLPHQPKSLRYRDYADLWLEIPGQDITIPIVGIPVTADGWDVSWLGSDAGYLNGTAFPTWLGNSGIAGHVVLANGLPGPFAELRNLKFGDEVIVRAWGLRHVYQVREVAHVSPRDQFVLRHEELSWLTLITCEGYLQETDMYQGRVAVRAVLVSIEADEANPLPEAAPEQMGAV